jgi:hypothetical protein
MLLCDAVSRKNWHLCGKQREMKMWKKKWREFFLLLWCGRADTCLVPVSVRPAGESQVKQSRIIGGGSLLDETGRTDRTASRRSGLRYRAGDPHTSPHPSIHIREFLLMRWSQHVHFRIGMVYSIPNVTGPPWPIDCLCVTPGGLLHHRKLKFVSS